MSKSVLLYAILIFFPFPKVLKTEESHIIGKAISQEEKPQKRGNGPCSLLGDVSVTMAQIGA